MPLTNTFPVANGRVGCDVHDLIAALKQADIIHVEWPGPDGRKKGMSVIGLCLVADPEALGFSVLDEKQAFALRAAKIAVDEGNEFGAYMALRALADRGGTPTH